MILKTRKILNILNAGYDSYDILYLHENLYNCAKKNPML